MATPEQMVQMQQRLDNARAQLPHVRDRALYRQGRLGRPQNEIDTLSNAINRLIELDAYQRQGIGWTEEDPEGNQRYQELRDSEENDRATALAKLKDVERRATRANSRDAAALGQDRRLFESIPRQERDLYRARRDWARQITDDTITAVPFATNQISDIANSGGQSYDALRILLDDSLRAPADKVTWIGQTAVLAEHVGAGPCDDQSAYAFTEANMRLPGTQLTLALLEPGHMTVIVGPPNRPESAHIDTWSLQARVTNPATYGLDNIQTGSVDYSQTADGRDLRALARPTLRHPLPAAPAPRAPLSLNEAMERMRLEGVGEEIYHITTTSTVRNSDSDSDDTVQGYGHPLSRAAFTANLDNDFQIQPESPGQASTYVSSSPGLSADTDNPSEMRYGDPASYAGAASYSTPATASYATNPYASYATDPGSSSSTSWGTGHVQVSAHYSLQDVQWSQGYGTTSAPPAPHGMPQDVAGLSPTGTPYGGTGSRHHRGSSTSQEPQQSGRQHRRGRGGGH